MGPRIIGETDIPPGILRLEKIKVGVVQSYKDREVALAIVYFRPGSRGIQYQAC
jgi:hypothetical protein